MLPAFFEAFLAKTGVIIPFSFYFAFKVVVFCFLFVLVRATFPRYRYDQLMDIG